MTPPPEIPVRQAARTQFRVPAAPYQPPGALEVYLWQAAPSPLAELPPEIKGLLNTYLEFSRFPLLVANDQHPGGKNLTWLDLRFSVPGRQIPFVLQAQVDQSGRLAAWRIGGGILPSPKAAGQSPRPG
jgi:hypothetical protein